MFFIFCRHIRGTELCEAVKAFSHMRQLNAIKLKNFVCYIAG